MPLNGMTYRRPFQGRAIRGFRRVFRVAFAAGSGGNGSRPSVRRMCYRMRVHARVHAMHLTRSMRGSDPSGCDVAAYPTNRPSGASRLMHE